MLEMNAFHVTLLAPCGMNCTVCYVYLRKKKPCLGCRGADEAKPAHCRKCKIMDCIQAKGLNYCHECPDFPCKWIKTMDKSYQKRYQVSLVAMTRRHQEMGADAYLKEEKIRWSCPLCGGIISMHDAACSQCGQAV